MGVRGPPTEGQDPQKYAIWVPDPSKGLVCCARNPTGIAGASIAVSTSLALSIALLGSRTGEKDVGRHGPHSRLRARIYWEPFMSGALSQPLDTVMRPKSYEHLHTPCFAYMSHGQNSLF